MNQALILNGGGMAAPYGDLAAHAETWARGRGLATTTFDLTQLEIKPCLGCFTCWLKTPGRCCYKDDMDQVVSRLAATDFQVLITPVSFGGYGYHLKKTLDRSIPILLPFFEWIGNEMHHPLRYAYGKRRLAAIGVLAEADAGSERIFHQLVRRNSINMHAEPISLVLNNRDAGMGLEEQLNALFSGKEN
jgi:multimeric flavodoxin WrbA